MATPFAEGDTVELTPTRWDKRGTAQAELDGWRVRIAGAIPGEPARATVLHLSKGGPVATARFEAPAQDPHPARIEPACPIHEECGGCGLQHVETKAAFAQKVAQAADLLGVELKNPIDSPRAFRYRAKTFMIPQARGPRLVLGARPPRGEELVDTSGCLVLREELEALAARVRAVLYRRTDEADHLRSAILRCNRKGQTQLTLVHRGEADWLEEAAIAAGADATFLQRHDRPGNLIHSEERELLIAGEPLVERFGAIEAVLPPTSFMQGNPEVAEALYLRAAGALQGRRIIDLYCGGGAVGLLALKKGAGRLFGLDLSSGAITVAKENARRNGLAARCHFLVADAKTADLRGDSILLNPPRAGCDPAVLDAIQSSEAKTLAYLSCNPETLARDLAQLGWTIESITPADMFPQTPHLELLAIATRCATEVT